MSSITFDALKFSDRLKEAGVPPEQAEAEARAMAEALNSSDIATKADVLELKSATKTELLELKMDVITWMLGLAMAQLGLLIGILIKLT